MISGSLKYQAYYTKSDHILDYMVGMLNVQSRDNILEPCGGDGAFVDKILPISGDINIDVLELNPDAILLLNNKYKNYRRIHIRHTDTLLDEEIINCHKMYDKIIGNPPYGARHDETKKSALNRLYPNLYTKESYTLFLYQGIMCLKEGGRLCFIIPDTFLSLHRHENLRKYILLNTKIIELSLFPSSFFPGVKFGYANLCIITLEKCSNITENLGNNIRVRTYFSDVSQLTQSDSQFYSILNQGSVLNSVASAFMIKANTHLVELINDESVLKIGDIADCVTGFYSGEDKKYLHPVSKEIKNAKRYVCATESNIRLRPLNIVEQQEGVTSADYLIPIVKGGNIPFIKPTVWFMDWSRSAVKEYRISKKCRFQNSEYYFKEGIAIPMIRSSKMTAALMESRLFDQSIVGVFPKDMKLLKYLLAFFNSKVCTELISAINPSANNSANYVKKIPFVIPNDGVIREIDSIVDEIMDILRRGRGSIDTLTSELDKIFYTIYSERITCRECSEKTVRHLNCQPTLPGLFD